jgi:hypothetical protein
MNRLRTRLLRIASSLPKGNPTRREILAVLKGAADVPDWAEGKKFKHPETGNDVAWGSLPAEEQKNLREKHDKGKKEEEGAAKGPAKELGKLLGGDLSEEEQKQALKEFSEAVGGADDPAKVERELKLWSSAKDLAKKYEEEDDEDAPPFWAFEDIARSYDKMFGDMDKIMQGVKSDQPKGDQEKYDAARKMIEKAVGS